MQESRLVVRGISLENLELWMDKFSFTLVKDPYFSASKSLLFLTVNSGSEEEFKQKFNGIKWKGDVLRVSSSIFPKFTPVSIPTLDALNTHQATTPEPTPDLTAEPTAELRRRKEFRIRNSRNRKIIKINLGKVKKIFKTLEKDVSVKDLSWPIYSSDNVSSSDSSSDSEESLEKLRGLFTLKGSDFSFEFTKQDVHSLVKDVKQDKEDIIKSFSENSQFFFNFTNQLQGIFKKEEFQELTLTERKEYTLIYKKRHKDASRRKNRFF